MDEREALVAKITNTATKQAKAKKMNEAQTKLYVETEVNKAIEEFEKKMENEKNTNSSQAQSISETTAATDTTGVNAQIAKTEVKNAVVKKYIVHTPVKNFCGEVAGVQFAYGKAEVKPGWILNWFKEHGYKVEEVSK